MHREALSQASELQRRNIKSYITIFSSAICTFEYQQHTLGQQILQKHFLQGQGGCTWIINAYTTCCRGTGIIPFLEGEKVS